jgi:hypothetical protein
MILAEKLSVPLPLWIKTSGEVEERLIVMLLPEWELCWPEGPLMLV